MTTNIYIFYVVIFDFNNKHIALKSSRYRYIYIHLLFNVGKTKANLKCNFVFCIRTKTTKNGKKVSFVFKFYLFFSNTNKKNSKNKNQKL